MRTHAADNFDRSAGAHAQAEASRLRAANGELSTRLGTAQQRLELAVARGSAALVHPAATPGAARPQAAPTEPTESGVPAAARQGRVRKQLFMQSAPATPATQAPQRPPLRAPPGAPLAQAAVLRAVPCIAACMHAALQHISGEAPAWKGAASLRIGCHGWGIKADGICMRVPTAEARKRGALGWFVDLLLPPSAESSEPLARHI